MLILYTSKAFSGVTLCCDGPWSARPGPFLGGGSHAPTQPLVVSNAISVAVPNGSKQSLSVKGGGCPVLRQSYLTHLLKLFCSRFEG